MLRVGKPHGVCLGQWLSKRPGLPCISFPTPTRTAISPLTVLYVGFPETAIKIQLKNQ